MVMQIALTNLEEKTGNHAMTVTYIASMMNLYRDQGDAMTLTYVASMKNLYQDHGDNMKLYDHIFKPPYYDCFIN